MRKEESSFLKKRSKRLLIRRPVRTSVPWPENDRLVQPGNKSFFGSFFSKKELLVSLGYGPC
jgi:hypothetical protein